MNFTLPDFPGGYALATPRLTLQAPQADDVEALWPHVTDLRITEFLAWEPHQSREETAAMIESSFRRNAPAKAFIGLSAMTGTSSDSFRSSTCVAPIEPGLGTVLSWRIGSRPSPKAVDLPLRLQRQ